MSSGGGQGGSTAFPRAPACGFCRWGPSRDAFWPHPSLQDALFASQEKFFQELFDSELASQATAEFEKAMKELAEEEPHLVEQFQKLSEAAGRVGEEAALGGWRPLNRPPQCLLRTESTLSQADSTHHNRVGPGDGRRDGDTASCEGARLKSHRKDY